MHHRSPIQTLVPTITDRRDVLECSRPTSRRVQDVKIRKLLGAVLARVRKREVNTNVPTIHPRPLITPKISTSYPHALPAPRSSSRGLLDHERRLEFHEGHVPFKGWLAKALAEETSRLRTWRLSIENPLITPTTLLYSHTPESSPIRTTILARTDHRPRIPSGRASDIRLAANRGGYSQKTSAKQPERGQISTYPSIHTACPLSQTRSRPNTVNRHRTS
jgi:hypothetical protein